jgi:hypothetical protein
MYIQNRLLSDGLTEAVVEAVTEPGKLFLAVWPKEAKDTVIIPPNRKNIFIV